MLFLWENNVNTDIKGLIYSYIYINICIYMHIYKYIYLYAVSRFSKFDCIFFIATKKSCFMLSCDCLRDNLLYFACLDIRPGVPTKVYLLVELQETQLTLYSYTVRQVCSVLSCNYHSSVQCLWLKFIGSNFASEYWNIQPPLYIISL